MPEEGIRNYNELSDEEKLELTELAMWKTDIHQQLEIIYSWVGFDEEGYRGRNYDNEMGYYIGEKGKELIVCNFIERKKSELIYSYQNKLIEDDLKKIHSSGKRLSYLNAVIATILNKVNANPIIQYGFYQTELMKPIEYPHLPSGLFKLPNTKPELHTGPFRGALLKGEGVAYSELTRHINKLLENTNEFLEKGTIYSREKKTDKYTPVSEKFDAYNDVRIFLEYNPRNHLRILEEKEFDKLVEYTNLFFNENKIPQNIKPIDININNQVILYTYGKIFKKTFPKENYSDELINFLLKVFRRLQKAKNPKIYFRKKFGTKPSDYGDLTKYLD